VCRTARGDLVVRKYLLDKLLRRSGEAEAYKDHINRSEEGDLVIGKNVLDMLHLAAQGGLHPCTPTNPPDLPVTVPEENNSCQPESEEGDADGDRPTTRHEEDPRSTTE
jgi:hypothetical protein